MKSVRKRRIILIIGIIICAVLEFLMITAPNDGTLTKVIAGKPSVININGIFQAVYALICIFMVCIDPKAGGIIARVLLILTTFSMVMGMIRGKTLSALPGAITVFLSLISVEVIRKFMLRIQTESITDYVTKLFNRRGLIKAIEEQNKAEKNFHMMFVHVKNIKSVNDSLGYEYGDVALEMVASRLKKTAPQGSIVSKLDGTEFAIALPENIDVSKVSEEIMASIKKPVYLESEGVGANFYMSAYAGVATYPEDANSILKLMRYADIAMYHASKSHDERIVYFNKNLEQELMRRSLVERYIQDSLKHDYFYLVYQPQYYSVSKKLRGFETLIRMKLPDGTNVSPSEFIPIAEKTDLIYRIDDYVLKRALTEFRDTCYEAKEKITLSVNISAKDISNPDFSNKLRKVLEETNFPANCLEIEITEYSLYDSLETTVNNIKEIRELGVRLALDDFGTGYTSLSQLLKLPFDLLKVDKSLIDTVESSEMSRDFVNLVIYMGHIMNSEVIAEGVESESQLKLLKDQECDFIQGYVWSRPLSLDDAKTICN